ncbi:diguanylate cyclase (GGDEF)-like protein [Motilibacter peucedani]|uniref:Diguanylate cyclase (GGDEF)-like protein n=1 Tax=Motilibacter peucedani TaxID=598650 RepID=A0A420XKK8_9ACTN|nr:bifunctional diguanylate cyclase/phosphodiesterase [Motilibacter peucedani]RKS69172.1 diguanylate cyclase (GGDEF)-like protein [Motilibacter peucedani]
MRRTTRSLLVFVVVSLVPVVAVGLVLVHGARQTGAERVLGRGRAQAQLVQSMGLAPVLFASDVEHLEPLARAQLQEVMHRGRVTGAVREVVLRDGAGRAVLREGADTSVPTPSTSRALRRALDGGVETVWLAEDPTAPSGHVITVMQPLQPNDLGVRAGALELELPYEDIATTVEADLHQSYWTLGASLLLVWLCQAALAWGTTRRLRRTAAESAHQALHDELTELPNRRMFGQEALAAAQRARAGGRPAALVLIDLDHFKEVNDTLGHECGDELLRVAGARLRGALGDDDLVARLGGDEFGLLLDGVAGEEEARLRLGQVRDVLAEELVLCDVPLSVEASFGVALVGAQAEDVTVLMRRADVAMYEAKRSGSSVVVWGSELDRHSSQRLALQAELRRALERDELVLHYQPQLDLASGRVAGVEALVRWQHPERGLLPPAEFLGAVEQSGLVDPFTSWVLTRAVQDCARWRAEGLDWAVSVNVSVRNLVCDELASRLGRLLERTGLPPDQLTIEITETALATDADVLASAVGALADLGVDISIDDFGTGFTTFALLSRLRVNEIKVDREFVGGALARDEDRAIVSAVVGLAGGIGCRVVAEGVEDGATADWLRTIGCTRAQGYHYSRPVPWPELAAARLGSPQSV